MRIASRAVGVVVLLALAATLVPESVQAFPGESASIPNLTFTSDTCQSATGMVTNAPEEGDAITVYAPDGSVTDSDFVDAEDPSFTVSFCTGVDTPGLQRIVSESGEAIGTFTVAVPSFRIKRISRSAVKGFLTLNGQPVTGVVVKFEVHVQSHGTAGYYTFGRSRTNRHGAVGVSCRKHKRCHFGVRFNYRDFVYSRGFVIHSARTIGRVETTRSDRAMAVR